MTDKNVPAEEVLILARSDQNGQFTRPIKDELRARGIPFSDPSEIKGLLAEFANRKVLSILCLRVNSENSLAWASLLYLTSGIGETFFNYIYDRARAINVSFGRALLGVHEDGFPDLSAVLAAKATVLLSDTFRRLDGIEIPAVMPEGGWGTWISGLFGEGSNMRLSDKMTELLAQIDARIEPTDDLGRYLGQITPIAKDIALEKNGKVRIMTLAGSKGLTVKATIIGGLETGFVPMDDCDPAEERRLLYVGMTRAEEFSFGTWARRRRGPTARMGRAQIDVRRQLSTLLDGAPVESQDGNEYLNRVSSV